MTWKIAISYVEKLSESNRRGKCFINSIRNRTCAESCNATNKIRIRTGLNEVCDSNVNAGDYDLSLYASKMLGMAVVCADDEYGIDRVDR